MKEKGSAVKLLVLLVVIVVFNLVVNLLSLNVLYSIAETGQGGEGELNTWWWWNLPKPSYTEQDVYIPYSTEDFYSCEDDKVYHHFGSGIYQTISMTENCVEQGKVCKEYMDDAWCEEDQSSTSSSSSSGVVGTMSQTCINTCDYFGYQSQQCLNC
jgi:hypothetical protein